MIKTSVTAMVLSVALVALPARGAESRTEAALRLLQSSGFDALLRHDAQLDASLREKVPESVPPELRVEIIGAIDKTMSYGEGRRALAESIAARFDAPTIDRNARWWATGSGQAIVAAHYSVFTQYVDSQIRFDPAKTQSPGPPVVSNAPFVVQLQAMVTSSIGWRGCLRMTVSFRRVCLEPGPASFDGERQVMVLEAASDLVRGWYGRVPATDFAAFNVYLESPGARDLLMALGEGYLKSRADRAARLRASIDDSVGRFARARIGGDGEATLQRVVKLVDDGRSLEEARMVLHLLRSTSPRDPRVPVELTRVAIKQAPIRDRGIGYPPIIAYELLDDAQRWMDIAMALDPRRADTLVLAGHVAWLKSDNAKGIALLEQARQIGTANPWLRINLGDNLWSSAHARNEDRGLKLRAAAEFEDALAKGLPARMVRRPTHALAHLYAELEDFPKARIKFQRLIADSSEYDKSEWIADYAAYLFSSEGDIDGAIASGREALKFGEVELHHSVLGEALLVKAGTLYVSGKGKEAALLVEEARETQSGLERRAPEFARLPFTLPAVFALHDSGMVRDFSGSDGGGALVLASVHASAADIERLVKFGADPNYLDPKEGTPLQMAIGANNVAAVRTLLKLGANVNTRGRDGELPLEVAERVARPATPKNLEIASLLRASGARKSAVATGSPLKAGYVYQALKRVGGSRYGSEIEAGTKVTFVRTCSYSDPALACLAFRNPTNKDAVLDVAMGKEQLVSWNEWFRELGPASRAD